MAGIDFTTSLANYMKHYQTGIVTPEEIIDAPLLQALRNNIDRDSFRGDYVEMKIQTQRGRSARGFGETDSEPYGGSTAYATQLIPIKRILSVATLTGQAKRLAIGGDSSWGNIVDDSIRDMMDDFNYACNLACHGNGTGALAECDGTAVFAANGAGTADNTLTLTCDNTYANSFHENVEAIQEDMFVSIWDTSGGAFLADDAGNTEWRVSAVAPGQRSTSTYAATTGTVTIIGVTSDINASVQDGDIIYLAGSKDKMPMGLGGIVANNNTGTYDDDYASVFATATFQGLTRANYPTLQAPVWKATDFGLSTENPADGTPTIWRLRDVSTAINTVARGRGRGKTNLLLCSSEIAMAMQSLSQNANGISVMLNSTDEIGNQPTVGLRIAGWFLCPDGRKIPISVVNTMSRYELIGLDTNHLKWYPLGNPDFKREHGTEWQIGRSHRRDEWDAPYEAYFQIGTDRSDVHWRMQDLIPDL